MLRKLPALTYRSSSCYGYASNYLLKLRFKYLEIWKKVKTVKRKHKIKIGSETYSYEVEIISKNGEEYVSIDAQIKSQKELGLQLLKTKKQLNLVTPELVNFLLNTCGISAVEIGRQLSIEASEIASWRRGEKSPDLNSWKAFREILIPLLEE